MDSCIDNDVRSCFAREPSNKICVAKSRRDIETSCQSNIKCSYGIQEANKIVL